MLFVIFVLMLIGGIVWGLATDWEYFSTCLLAVLSGACVVVSLLVMVFSCGAQDADIARYEARREMLVYQLEANVYDNDAGDEMGKRALYEDIQAWNENLAANKKLQRNFWVGIYVPNIYDQFEPINLSSEGQK